MKARTNTIATEHRKKILNILYRRKKTVFTPTISLVFTLLLKSELFLFSPLLGETLFLWQILTEDQNKTLRRGNHTDKILTWAFVFLSSHREMKQANMAEVVWLTGATLEMLRTQSTSKYDQLLKCDSIFSWW